MVKNLEENAKHNFSNELQTSFFSDVCAKACSTYIYTQYTPQKCFTEVSVRIKWNGKRVTKEAHHTTHRTHLRHKTFWKIQPSFFLHYMYSPIYCARFAALLYCWLCVLVKFKLSHKLYAFVQLFCYIFGI